MTFHGLFVGIDHYDARFDGLRYARRDATALCALFNDNLAPENPEGQATLLLDGQATKDNFVAEMRHLADVSTGDDFVVIAFSGHGVAGGALAVHDTLPDKLAETSLSLAELTELTSRIRAHALLLVLDCCFSGHAADKVLRVPQDGRTSRNGSVSATRKIAELREAGYVVIAAADKDQEAFEDQHLRHGVLSYYLIQGLLGHSEAVEDGKIYILKLAHFVSSRVRAHKHGLLQRTQVPVLSGRISHFELEIFKPGKLYKATADSLRSPPVSADLSSLRAYDISSSVVNAWRGRLSKLNQLQMDAVNDGALLEGMNVLVSAPTSAGKTMVGELAAMRAVAEGKKAVFLLPTRALVNEQYEKMEHLYRPLGIRTVRATGELRDHLPDLYQAQFEIAVLTYEKFIGLLPRHPDLLNAGVLVIDEIQSLTLPDRGPLLETLLTWLRVREGSTETPQLVGLSAVLGKPEELARWLRANLVTSTRREVPLFEGVLGPDGVYRYRDDKGDESNERLLAPQDNQGQEDSREFTAHDRLAVRLVTKLVSDGQQVIVFRASRAGARMLARRLAGTLGLPAAVRALDALSDGDGGRTTDQLRACLQGGVAFHIADLTAEERRLLEVSFTSRDSEVRVLVATTTLAQGVNLPADAVVVCELEHPSSDNRPYAASEYKNMAGRAGRVGHSEQGNAYILARGTVDADQKWRRYVQAKPEEVRSALRHPTTDVRGTILAALSEPAARDRPRSGPEIERFLAATFAAHQARVSGGAGPFPGAEIRRMLNELVGAEFVSRASNGYILTDLGRLTVHSGLGVDSVVAVANALKAVPVDRLNRATLICAAQLTAELEDPRFNREGRNAHRSHTHLAGRLRDRGAAEEMVFRLMGVPSRDGGGLGRARRSLACLMWTEGVALSSIERAISHQSTKTRREDIGPVQQAVQRAADVITTVVDIAFQVHPDADLGELPGLLPAQLEMGIVGGLVPLAWHLKEPLDRSVYLDLTRAGLTSPADILAVGPEALLDCVGGRPDRLHAVREAAADAQAQADEGGSHDLCAPSQD